MFTKPQISLEQKYDVPSLENQYRDILNNFDFKTVAMIMSMPCRPVYEDDNYDKIIGYKRLNICSKHVMKRAREGDTLYWSSCGPFKVTYRFGILELNFVMETWSWD